MRTLEAAHVVIEKWEPSRVDLFEVLAPSTKASEVHPKARRVQCHAQFHQLALRASAAIHGCELHQFHGCASAGVRWGWRRWPDDLTIPHVSSLLITLVAPMEASVAERVASARPPM